MQKNGECDNNTLQPEATSSPSLSTSPTIFSSPGMIKHKNKAKFGWYRYDTRIALPVYNDVGELERYNIFKLRMLVRHDADGKMYLYDFLRTKKETSSPLE